MSEPGTPYVSVDGDEVFFPVAHYSYNEARTAAASFAQEMDGPWGRSRYTGKHPRGLHDHDEPWNDECGHACPPEPTWCFELYEGTYRS